MFIYIVVSLLAAADAFYWWWADGRLRPLRRAGLWRSILAVLVGGQFLVLCWWILLPWTLRGLGGTLWVPLTAWLYVWHLLVLPLTVICLLLGYCGWGVGTGLGWLLGRQCAEATRDIACPASEEGSQPSEPAPLVSTRRQFLGAAAAMVPQGVLGVSLAAATTQATGFRVRRFSLAFAELPRALDGVTIAHLSDTHSGRFVREAQLERIAQATLDLDTDLVVFTGDLIDFNLADLPPAVSMLRQIQKRRPLAMCVGNHDLFEGAGTFRHRLRTAELPLLEDERASFTLRGERLDVLGLDWGTPQNPRNNNEEVQQRHMARALAQQSVSTFSILLAHHPHAFNMAAPGGIPLTLAGHTHGGQLMLSDRLGAGSVMFDYWSGLYEKEGGRRKLVVSNGVGNWFPLRINAPAEIVHLTLRRA